MPQDFIEAPDGVVYEMSQLEKMDAPTVRDLLLMFKKAHVAIFIKDDADLVSFGNFLLKKKHKSQAFLPDGDTGPAAVTHADMENWKIERRLELIAQEEKEAAKENTAT